MSIPSWKKYGGINSLEKTNNINVNALSVNHLTLRNSYLGTFAIDGELSVTKDTTIQSNIIINGNTITNYDSITNRNNYIQGFTIVSGNAFIGQSLEVNGNTLLKGNLHVLQNYEIEKNLKINGNIFQLENVIFYANNNEIGLNKINPTFTFDIVSDQPNGLGLQIQSNTLSNKNIICQNSENKGIYVESTSLKSTLSFSTNVNNTTNYASIVYTYDGYFYFDILNSII